MINQKQNIIQNLNDVQFNNFIKGWSNDISDNYETKQSFLYGLNGRLYSENGVLNFTSIKGTSQVYSNGSIVKYLGWYAFKDELIVFVKYNSSFVESSVTNTKTAVKSADGNINSLYTDASKIIGNLLPTAYIETVTEVSLSITTPTNPLSKDNYSIDNTLEVFDLEKYYKLSGTGVSSDNEISNFLTFPDTDILIVPPYNATYEDAIISLKYDSGGVLQGTVLWKGYMNWDINRKIIPFGNDEGNNYKRLYFTDNLNPFRTLNLKDKNLAYKRAIEFNAQQFSTMLRPDIYAIESNGQLSAMSVQYAYRLITDNGQVTAFSPFSEIVPILKDDSNYDFEGAAIGTKTNKAVTIKCNIFNSENFKDIEAIAITYETDTVPSDIISLGIKPAQDVVSFTHSGTEISSTGAITLADITDYKNTWRYCNTLTAKNNKLIPAGLRNDPYPFNIKTIESYFLLRGWNANGDSYSYLINPQPYTYKYIDPLNRSNYIRVEKRLFTSFLVFGGFTLTLKNVLTGNSISKTFVNTSDTYQEYVEEVFAWLNTTSLTDFPNLLVSQSGVFLFFELQPYDTITDLNDFEFSVDTLQSIIDFENQYKIITINTGPSSNGQITLANLVEGGISNGYNKGNGVRLSWQTAKDKVLTKATSIYTTGPILDIETPTLLKSFVKDEIYRFSIQMYKSGQPLFSVVLGDLQAPKLGDTIKYIDNSGSPVITTEKYVNQSDDGTYLYAHRLQLKVEVRMNSFFNKFIDSYQIHYVKRDSVNRTILAQGIAAPLIRIAKTKYPNLAGTDLTPEVYRKWTLPFMGGPTYPEYGLNVFDDPTKGENWDEHNSLIIKKYRDATQFQRETAIKSRIITNRKMFYFDSPDFIYNRVSTDNITNTTIEIVGTVKTDHNIKHIRDANDKDYPKYSRKIPYNSLAGNKDYKPYFVNVSVFSEYIPYFSSHNIDKNTRLLNKGELLSSGVMGTNFEISNNALSLARTDWFYHDLTLYGHRAGGGHKNQMESEFLQSSQVSQGYPTVILRGENDVFTDSLIGTHGYAVSLTGVPNNNTLPSKPIHDTHAIINLKSKNVDGIYGGRSEYAFSRNVFIPLSDVIPLYDKTNQAQKTVINGDSYVTLFLRTKNDFSSGTRDYKKYKMRNSQKNASNSDSRDDWNRGAAWAYAVVLETEVEPRLTENYRFYKSTSGNDFQIEIDESINEAYYKADDVRLFIPRPYNFKDDPLLTNILAASKTKLNGDFFDSWTEFPVNEFYELSQDKGEITNIVDWADEVYVIQERETNLVKVTGVDFVNTQDGNAITVKRGEGTSFLIHKKVNDYGTAFRRNLVRTPFGFGYFDENKTEFIFNNEPLLIKNSLQLEVKKLIGSNTITDIEGFYDQENKEVNIILSLSNSTSLCLSYNIALRLFNGVYDYDNTVYFAFDNKVFAPMKAQQNILTRLNIGNYLSFFSTQKTMKIKVSVNKSPNSIKIFKATSVYLNITYKIKSITLTDDKGNVRVVTSTHPHYKIREGKHSVPFLNTADANYLRDYVGTVEYEIDSQSNAKVTIFSIINHIRKSF